jgi:hypothetical protein
MKTSTKSKSSEKKSKSHSGSRSKKTKSHSDSRSKSTDVCGERTCVTRKVPSECTLTGNDVLLYPNYDGAHNAQFYRTLKNINSLLASIDPSESMTIYRYKQCKTGQRVGPVMMYGGRSLHQLYRKRSLARMLSYLTAACYHHYANIITWHRLQ